TIASGDGVDLKWIQDGAAAASLAWLSLMGLVYVVVFLSDHRKPAHGWLALQSLLSCAFPLWVLGLSRDLLGAAVPTACVAGVSFTHAHYGAARPRPEWAALLLVGALVAGLARGGLVGPATPSLVTLIVLALAVVHQIDFLARRAAHQAMNARILLAGWLLIGVGEAIDLVAGVHL